MKFFIKTYGCQMNEYDSQRLKESFIKQGYQEIENYNDADIVVLNTCSIREKASHKVYSELGRISKLKENSRIKGKYIMVVVAGCVPEVEKETLFEKAPCVDIVIGPQSYSFLVEEIKKAFQNLQIKTLKNGLNKIILSKNDKFINLELKSDKKFDFLREEGREFNGVSAFVSIQEGCNKFCTYCIVPQTRGREVQRKFEDIVHEVDSLAKNGCKEITLLGQNVTSYCSIDEEKNEVNLVKLIQKISKIPEIKRIRYTTSHPIDTTDDLIEEHGKNKKLMPCLHFPVQSGSNSILKKMNRKYTKEEYLELIKKFRKSCKNIAFSSDFIVAFPTETDEDFYETMNLIKEVNFGIQSFSFKYSPRPNTIAAKMEGKIPNDLASRRLDILQEVLEAQRIAFNKSCEGKELEVLFDDFSNDNELQIKGRTEYMQIAIVECQSAEDKKILYREIKKVRIKEAKGQVLFAEILS